MAGTATNFIVLYLRTSEQNNAARIIRTTLVLFRSSQRSPCRCIVSPLFQMYQPVDVSCRC